MPNIAKVLKDEIQRLAKIEIKAAITSLRKDNAALKHTVADLKRRLAGLEAVNKRLVSKVDAVEPKADENGSAQLKARITGKMIRSIRGRLGLSQDAFAKLIGVSGQSVYQWEHSNGRLKFRGGTEAAIVGIRKLGKREVKERFASLKNVR